MKNHRSPSPTSIALLLAGLTLTGAGCSSRLARENVFANTESAFGLTVAENPQTQMYEVKLGYARHELFYVPTSKLVFYQKPGRGLGGEQSPCCTGDFNDPSKTPEVLADIQIGGKKSGNEGGFQIRQRLAIGKEAVTSPAATALLANANATDAKVLMKALEDPQNKDLNAELNALLKKGLATSPLKEDGKSFTSTRDYANHLANKLAPGSTLIEIQARGGDNLERLISALKPKVKE